MNGAGILARYQNSLIKALQSVYPEVQWEAWKFPRAPQGFWNDKSNALTFLESLRTEIGIQQTTDWHKISTKQLSSHKGMYFLY
jgi:hypothetical protein